MRKLLLVVLITNLITAGLVWQFQASKHSSEVWKLRHEFATIQLNSIAKTKEDERLHQQIHPRTHHPPRRASGLRSVIT